MIVFVPFQVFEPSNSTELTFVLKVLIMALMESAFEFQICRRVLNACHALLVRKSLSPFLLTKFSRYVNLTVSLIFSPFIWIVQFRIYSFSSPLSFFMSILRVVFPAFASRCVCFYLLDILIEQTTGLVMNWLWMDWLNNLIANIIGLYWSIKQFDWLTIDWLTAWTILLLM